MFDGKLIFAFGVLLLTCGAVRAGGMNTGGGMDTHDEPAVAILIGASYAQSWPIDELGGYRITNVGIDGQQSSELLERFRRDVLSRKPDAVIIWGFINDIHRNPKDQIEQTRKRVRENFTKMVELAQARGIRPILVTEVTIRPPAGLSEKVMGWLGKLRGKSSYQDFVNRNVRELNAWLRDFAARKNLLLLDFEPVIAGADGARDVRYVTPDGNHINQAGYEQLTRYARSRFRQQVHDQ